MGDKTKLLWNDPIYRKKMSDAHKGKLHEGSFKPGHKVSNSGRTWIKKGQFAGPKNFFFGKKFCGNKSPVWKGSNVGYDGLHGWIRSKFGEPTKCQNQNCFYPRKNKRGQMMRRPKRYEWASLNHSYTRNRKDWVMLCTSCHGILDKSKDKTFIVL